MPGFLNAQAGAGILGGLERGLYRGAEMAERRRQFDEMQAYRNAMLGAKSGRGGGAQGLTFEEIDPNVAGTAAGKMFIPGKSVPSVYYQGAQFAKPTAEEKAETGEALQVATFGEQLGKQWKESGFQEGSGKQAVGGMVEKVLPGQISQRVMSPKYKEFGDTKRIMSEVALRAATGASAPPAEVQTYMGFLPEPGDKASVATNKINNFYDRLTKKVEARALLMESQGLDNQAKKIREVVIANFENARAKSLESFSGKSAKKDPKEDAAYKRYQELLKKAGGTVAEEEELPEPDFVEEEPYVPRGTLLNGFPEPPPLPQ